jgi:hypothetical protein
MMIRNLKSAAGHQPDHFEVAMISDVNELFRVVVDLAWSSTWDGGHIGFQRIEKIDPGDFALPVI